MCSEQTSEVQFRHRQSSQVRLLQEKQKMMKCTQERLQAEQGQEKTDPEVIKDIG